MPTFDEILAKATPSETTVSLVLGGQYLEQLRQLEAELANAKPPQNLGEANPVRVIAEQIEALREQMAGTEVNFRLRSMAPLEWDKVKYAQPERKKDEDQDAFVERFFTWMCQLVSRTCVDPVMTPEQVAELVAKMPGSSWDRLSGEAWGINSGKVSVPFSVAASVLIRDSAQA